MRRPVRVSTLAAGLLLGALVLPTPSAGAVPAATGSPTTYLVVLDTGVSSAAAAQLVTAAGGTVTTDLTRQIGVVVAESSVAGFDAALRASDLVTEAGPNLRFQGIPDGGPAPADEPSEALQWDMQQIRTDEAHEVQAGSPMVQVGVIDSGIEGHHPDFLDANGVSNVDCALGRDFVPAGPSVGNPDPCTDNQFHGTHVAGTIGARANGYGVVGVAPNVTLIPVKVCDPAGYCYANSVVEGITYAGDQKFEVVNMSLFIDDDQLLQSTEFKCNSDPAMRAMRRATERALAYARNQGVTPVAALGNSDQDLAHPVDANGQPISDECEVVPAESQGVIGTMALGRDSEKASYSNYGAGATDVAAPGGNGTTGDCTTTILSTIPAGYGCIQGTSMASPHTAGVVALIISQFGEVGRDGDVQMSPQQIEAYLQSTTVDIGLSGYDECFGNGRIDALRAVRHDTSRMRDASAPNCPEYTD